MTESLDPQEEPKLPQDAQGQDPQPSQTEETGQEEGLEKMYQTPPAFQELKDAAEAMAQLIHSEVVGQRNISQLMLTAILADGHILLEGNPGVAKTLMGKLLAKSLDVSFGRIQFTPDLMPSDVLGTNIYHPERSAFDFHPGPIFAQVVLIDEINRAPAKTQAALFECMQEHQVSVDGTSYTLKRPFLVIATQNPIEQEGTYRLPEAQLDRFLFKINVGYPNLSEEEEILTRVQERKRDMSASFVEPLLNAEKIERLQALIREVKAEPSLLKHIAEITHATRVNPNLMLGASPRASLAMLQAGKALAAIQGRDFLTPDDIHFVAFPILRHRVQLTPEREMEGAQPDQIIRQILDSLEVPR